MRKVVISLGGSILVKGEDDEAYIRELVEGLASVSDDVRFIIVTGGGKLARDHISIGRRVGLDEATLDSMGILATRMNAWLIIGAFKCVDVYPRPFTSLEEAIIGASAKKFTIGGGTHPGHTTDAVSALIAEMWRADLFINLTAVDGAYTADPKKDTDAERIPEMTSKELVELVSGTVRGAGSHSVMDPLAASVIHRAGIRTMILDGRDISNLLSCISGERTHGTVIAPGE
ncbi:MAG: UMP kinase [Candidatus Thermoplasmatota archaeon]|nr:UMP kinase [Candidatus Thermoplasmatota archaeon]